MPIPWPSVPVVFSCDRGSSDRRPTVIGLGRQRTTRLLRGLLQPGETVVQAERLPVLGSWVLTTRALYVFEQSSTATRLALYEISSVHFQPEQRIVTIRTTTGKVVVVATRRNSAILKRLSQLDTSERPITAPDS